MNVSKKADSWLRKYHLLIRTYSLFEENDVFASEYGKLKQKANSNAKKGALDALKEHKNSWNS